MAFNILHDRVVVVPEKVEERSLSSGLVLIDEGYIQFGTITHVGPGRVSELNGEQLHLDLKEGDRVFFPRAAGRPFTVDGTDYLLLTHEELVGVMVND